MIQHIQAQKVAVIGAGVSGVSAAIRLRQRGVDVKVFERTQKFGGVWVYDERIAQESTYPSVLPSVGDTPFEILDQVYQVARDGEISIDHTVAEVLHAPPGPCYQGLKNNVSMIEMEMQTNSWDSDGEEFVPHFRLADYIQRAARKYYVDKYTSFGTRVNKVWKDGEKWTIISTQISQGDGKLSIVQREEAFDGVVVASGHYHAPNIPDISGLAKWKKAFPELVMHSKGYRDPSNFDGQNVLLVGAGVSSTDIAKELAAHARSTIQVSRGGMFDLPSSLLPPNACRVGGIRSFDAIRRDSVECLNSSQRRGPIPGTVTLETGEQLCDIDRVVLCTGYHVSYPFLQHLHADGCPAAEADEFVIATDGQQTHNLHKDIFYIPDPTLAFIGVPYHVATFSLFDFQAVALAAVFSGAASLPSQEVMRIEYNQRLAESGAGRNFHSLRAEGHEDGYVNQLVELVARGGDHVQMQGHSQRWHEAYARRLVRSRGMRSAIRSFSDEQAARELLQTCL